MPPALPPNPVLSDSDVIEPPLPPVRVQPPAPNPGSPAPEMEVLKKLKDGGEVEEKDKYGVIFGDLNDKDRSKEDPNCLDSSIWNDISLLEEIDFTAIQLEATNKVLYPDVDEEAMKIEPYSQIQMKCDDLNLDGDEGKNLIDGEPNNPSCDPPGLCRGYQARKILKLSSISSVVGIKLGRDLINLGVIYLIKAHPIDNKFQPASQRKKCEVTERGLTTFELYHRQRIFVGDEAMKDGRVFTLVQRWVASNGVRSA
ncbi:hypothetical protein LguiA_035674 [Lonicera macranthoides]